MRMRRTTGGRRGRLSSARRPRLGFTLVEVLASIILLGVGIVAAQRAMGSISRDEARARQREHLEALAESKLGELLTEAAQTPGDQSGDFGEQGEADVTWTFTVEASGVENLDAVRLVVQPRRTSDSSPEAVLSTLRFKAPTTGSTGATNS